MSAQSREDRVVRVNAIEVARTNARHHLDLAERCAVMVAHWAGRAEAHRADAERWAAFAEQGARMLARDIAEAEHAAARAPAVNVASWEADAANDAERRSA